MRIEESSRQLQEVSQENRQIVSYLDPVSIQDSLKEDLEKALIKHQTEFLEDSRIVRAVVERSSSIVSTLTQIKIIIDRIRNDNSWFGISSGHTKFTKDLLRIYEMYSQESRIKYLEKELDIAKKQVKELQLMQQAEITNIHKKHHELKISFLEKLARLCLINDRALMWPGAEHFRAAEGVIVSSEFAEVISELSKATVKLAHG